MAGKVEELSSVREPDSRSTGSEAIGGCGRLKRKAEANEEAAAVDVVVVDRSKSEQVLLVREELDSEEEVYEDSPDYDTDEDPEVSFAKLKAWFEARVLESDVRYGVTYMDYSVEDDDDELMTGTKKAVQSSTDGPPNIH